jgi:phospholipid/cholesterol/gamma-HCH transport system substrate-binding protein
METRASYILVGSFVLGLIGVLIGIVIWLAGIEFDKTPARYVTYFEGNVTGLGIGSPVRYRGVPVGSVRDIRLDPDNVERVKVLLEASPDTPIKEDTVAELALQGITGVAFIQLTGGTRAAPLLTSKKEGELPTISSRESLLQEVITRLPQVIEKAVLVADRVSLLFDEKNLAAVAKTLQNLQTLSNSIATEDSDLVQLLKDGRKAASALSLAAADIRDLTQTLNQEIGPVLTGAGKTMTDFRATMTNIRKAAVTVNDVVASVESLVENNKDPLSDFARSGLYEFSLFIAEARVLVDSLTRLSNRIERDPAYFLFGDSQKGVKTQ